jgi:hypothetical protein
MASPPFLLILPLTITTTAIFAVDSGGSHKRLPLRLLASFCHLGRSIAQRNPSIKQTQCNMEAVHRTHSPPLASPITPDLSEQALHLEMMLNQSSWNNDELPRTPGLVEQDYHGTALRLLKQIITADVSCRHRSNLAESPRDQCQHNW